MLILGVVIAVFQQWCGTNVIFNYAQEIFANAGYDLTFPIRADTNPAAEADSAAIFVISVAIFIEGKRINSPQIS